jgi:hypothetical protein
MNVKKNLLLLAMLAMPIIVVGCGDDDVIVGNIVDDNGDDNGNGNGEIVNPFPEFPPSDASNLAVMDRDQMMFQLKLSGWDNREKTDMYENWILPKLKEVGSNVEYVPKDLENTNGTWTWSKGTSTVANIIGASVTVERTAGGLWNNYIQAWEPGGDYFTGEKFYKPLALHNLEGVTPTTWWSSRRPEIFREVQKIWGKVPDAANDLKIDWEVSGPTLVTEATDWFGNTTVLTNPYKGYTIKGTIDISGYPEVREAPVISATLRTSVNAGTSKIPVIINYAMGFFGMVFDDEELWNSVAPEGIGMISFDAGSLQADNGAGLTSYLIGLVNKGNWRKPTDWGSLVAWAWGTSRLIDFFETSDLPVDPAKIGLTGHSRYGKATLVTMAYEPRVAIAFPSSSGSFGAAPSRRHLGQDLGNSQWDQEYHWMAGNFMTYIGVHESSTDGYMPRKVLDMPVDAESLIALCAPRPIFIGSGDVTGDSWVDPYGQYLSCVAASPVYELLGKKGIVMNSTLPGYGVPYPTVDTEYLGGDIAYRRHNGGHSAGPNYPAFIKFVKRNLLP